ncbi:MAG: MdtA/MuxA family multidrug efflux RND transporter periplasmic adaptor subunit [Burkholderiales bacterium]
MTRLRIAAAIVAALALGAVAYRLFPTRGASTPPPAGRAFSAAGARAVPVVAAAATRSDVSVQLDALGTVTPLSTVTVRSRVDGELVKIEFEEGQMVRAGQLLAQIDPRPYAVALAQAEAALARDQALLQNTRVDLERFRTLQKQDSIAEEQVATQDALVHQTEATVKVDEATIANARLQLGYSRITAPIAGRVGLRQVDLGNIVHASDANGIVVITQLQPMSVVFTIPEDSIPTVMSKLRAGEQLRVDAYDRGGQNRLATGVLATADNQIDPTTGTLKLRARFDNGDLGLFPSQFVNVRMVVDVLHGATVVPTAAVQRGTPGTFVYAVDPEKKTVSVRKVRLGPSQGEQVAIQQGVAPGVLVVVDGADKLREGAEVELVTRDAGPPKPPARKPGREGLSPEEREQRWKALDERIDKGEFGEEIRKLPEEERKQRMRELRRQRSQ